MEIAVISGKGGTGKSSISAAFATLQERVVLADCDVDAANLYLIFDPVNDNEQVYIAGQKASIDYNLCTNCALCIDYCSFDAIHLKATGPTSALKRVTIDEISCDGCKLCTRVCPANAIIMTDNDKSRMYSGTFRKGYMVYGRLAPGEENSGKLVNIVRDRAKKIADEYKIDITIIDGPPGIGCSVISSITGTDIIVVVTEPTISGLHDLRRTIELTCGFNSTTWVLINKFDLNREISDRIEEYCSQNKILFAGKLSFDARVVEAMVNCKSVIEYAPDSAISKEISQIWEKITHYK
ncbi:MAG: (4Fe-4S)-binding protein [Bacteroidetes bacterium HGW-Bacteroidetes-8]|jgi:MinD superfamily P-loop ATPase|nr:MAG: (4Fe-4S)-binding protein [Bacteroidetes bacterium HGW-Bacteroidetes-8]